MEFFLPTLGVCALTTGIIQSSPPIAKRRLVHTKTLGLKNWTHGVQLYFQLLDL